MIRFATVLTLISLTALKGSAQWPLFHSNTTSTTLIADGVLNHSTDSVMRLFAPVIVYTYTGHWGRFHRNYYILGDKRNGWHLIHLSQVLRRVKGENSDVGAPIPDSNVWEHRKVSKEDVQNLLIKFREERFWVLNTDSLNITSIKRPDGHIDAVQTGDGLTYYLIARLSGKVRCLKAEDPETYLQHFPEITVRRNFLNCSEAFDRLIGRR